MLPLHPRVQGRKRRGGHVGGRSTTQREREARGGAGRQRPPTRRSEAPREPLGTGGAPPRRAGPRNGPSGVRTGYRPASELQGPRAPLIVSNGLHSSPGGLRQHRCPVVRHDMTLGAESRYEGSTISAWALRQVRSSSTGPTRRRQRGPPRREGHSPRRELGTGRDARDRPLWALTPRAHRGSWRWRRGTGVDGAEREGVSWRGGGCTPRRPLG